MLRSILNRFMSSVGDHLLLSLLWLAGCLPVVTAPVATAALFEVTRQRSPSGAGIAQRAGRSGPGRWVGGGGASQALAGEAGAGDDEPGLVRAFAGAFRQHLTPALVAGYAWAAIGGVLLLDLVIAGGMSRPAGDLLRVALLVVGLLYALATVALFPVLVAYQAPPHRLLRTSVVVALLFPARSVPGLAVLVAAGVVVWLVPLAIIIVPSLVATVIWRLYAGAFDRLRAAVRIPPLIPLAKEIMR